MFLSSQSLICTRVDFLSLADYLREIARFKLAAMLHSDKVPWIGGGGCRRSLDFYLPVMKIGQLGPLLGALNILFEVTLVVSPDSLQVLSTTIRGVLVLVAEGCTRSVCHLNLSLLSNLRFNLTCF